MDLRAPKWELVAQIWCKVNARGAAFRVADVESTELRPNPSRKRRLRSETPGDPDLGPLPGDPPSSTCYDNDLKRQNRRTWPNSGPHRPILDGLCPTLGGVGAVLVKPNDLHTTFGPTCGRLRTKFGRLRTMWISGKFGRSRSKSNRCRSNSGQMMPKAGQIRSKFGRRRSKGGPNLAVAGKSWSESTKVCRIRSTTSRVQPKFVDLGPKFDKIGQSWKTSFKTGQS